MDEKLFVICEVTKPEGVSKPQAGTTIYTFPNGRNYWVPDDVVIPASRLRYGKAFVDKDEQAFELPDGWVNPETRAEQIFTRLVLLPPAPVDEWEKWVEEYPSVGDPPWEADFKAWLRRMPRGK